MNTNPATFAQRLAMRRLTPKERPSPAGGQEFGNNSYGGGLVWPWWWYGSYAYYYPWYGLNPYYPPLPANYGQTYFDGTYVWYWNGFRWVPNVLL